MFRGAQLSFWSGENCRAMEASIAPNMIPCANAVRATTAYMLLILFWFSCLLLSVNL